MTWALIICTSGWLLCGTRVEISYPDEPACYRALNEVIKQQGASAFKYVVCGAQKKGGAS